LEIYILPFDIFVKHLERGVNRHNLN